MGSAGTQEYHDVVVLGAGPTGLGAAKRLNQINGPSWALFEAASHPGGLSATEETPEGFLVDHGGHIVFSHYKYFDECLDEALPNKQDWQHHQRISYIRYKDSWVPYPFQNNLAMLPLEDKVTCLNGMVDAAVESASSNKPPQTFDEWALRNLGEGIANAFVRPYSYKVWAIDTKLMQCKWLGERVSNPDVKKVMNNVLRDQVAGNWGPNATFRFPSYGGTGGLWTALAKTLPQDKMHYNKRAVNVNEDSKVITFDDGSKVGYGRLLTTLPLDTLVNSLNRPEDYSSIKRLFHSGTNVVGIGIRGKTPERVGDTCWYYFPESNCPFYRATIFNRYGPGNAPGPEKKLPTLHLADGSAPASTEAQEGPYWSIILEVAESEYKPVDRSKVIQDSIQGLINTSILDPKDEIVMTFTKHCDKGYPTPSLERDGVINEVLPALTKKGIYSRGRFGSWKYEVANQDHSFMLGVEAVDHMAFGSIELSLNYPDTVNGRANKERSLHTLAGQV